MLRVAHLNVFYGPIPALLDISLTVPMGGITAVLGANGAGKSSLLRALSGLARKSEGFIEFDGKLILRRGLGLGARPHHLRADEITRLGVAHVPEGRQMFNDLSAEESLRLGAFTRRRADLRVDLERVYSYFPVLYTKRRVRSSSLSGGEQQMLAISRALMSRPKLLMLDEPSVGLAPKIIAAVFEILVKINQAEQCTILVVEQNAQAALDIAQHGYVLEAPGHITAQGTSKKLRTDEAVQRAYLGGKGKA